MPLQSPFSLLTLTDHCPAAQSSPAASLGYHLTALCPTAHCPHSSAVVPSSPPQPQCQGHPLHPPLASPHCPAHPNQCSHHPPHPCSSPTACLTPTPLPSTSLPLAALSLPLPTLNCCPFPPHWLCCFQLPTAPTSLSSGHSTEPHSVPLCRAAPQCLLGAAAGGLGAALLWRGLSHTPRLPLPHPCVHTLHP